MLREKGYEAHNSYNWFLQSPWNSQEQLLHINAIELLALFKAVASPLVPSNTSIVLAKDNLAATYVINKKGSNSSRTLQSLYRLLSILMLMDGFSSFSPVESIIPA